MPKSAIAEVTTWSASAREDIANYSAAGAEGIGLWEFKIPSGQEAELAEAVRQAGLRATLCCPAVPSVIPESNNFLEPREPKARVEAMRSGIERLATFDPLAILVVTGDPRGLDQTEARAVSVRGLREIARFAADLGQTIGLEPYRPDAGSLVSTIPETLELIDEIGMSNVKVIVDTWHFWDQPGSLHDIAGAATQIVGVQVNDYRRPNRGWCDRVLPGDGEIDLSTFIGTLADAGYDGWYEVEVFSDNGVFGNDFPDSVWSRDPLEVARGCTKALQELFGRCYSSAAD